jgi:hypothetical protein
VFRVNGQNDNVNLKRIVIMGVVEITSNFHFDLLLIYLKLFVVEEKQKQN